MWFVQAWRHLRSRVLLAGFVALFFAACTDGKPVDPNDPPTPGTTEFTSEDMGDSFSNSRSTGPGGMEPSAAAPNESDASKQGAPSGRTGTVEEADLYRVSGNTLFYLNTYKGLTVFDLQDPKNPKKLANLPVFGYPIEMFIEKSMAYALVRDALYLVKVNGKLEFHRRSVSQLVSIDISNPAKPVVLQRFDIEGQLREGVSRKIDNTVYVVSYQPRWYWSDWSYSSQERDEQVTVYSFNVQNPKAIQKIQSLELLAPQPKQQPDPNGTTSEYTYFSGVTISATSNALMVGERWGHSKYTNDTRGCGRYEYFTEVRMTVVDISDVTGKINIHTKFTVRGDLSDQFKQTYLYDEVKKQGIYLGIFARNEWSSTGCNGQRIVRNTFVSVDITDGKSPKVLSEIAFGKPNETVRGSVFDEGRKIAYAITAVNTDPLYALSFADPNQLKILSEIDGLSGDMNVFRFIENRQFLIGIGRDTSASCTGFGSNQRGTNIAVSIIDVRNLSKIRLVQRKCVAVQGADWVHSELNWNLDQAHKMIGMFSDGQANLITVPVSYYQKTTVSRWWGWYYDYKSAIGIMKWDISKYDDTKDETQQNVLENIATMEHPKGAVKRTIITQLPQFGRAVINLSDTHISLIDLQTISRPTLLSVFELAPYIRSVYRFGNHLVEQVGLGPYSDQYNEFRVKALGQGDLNDAPSLHTFKVGEIQNVIRWNNYLLIFRRYLDPTADPNNPQYDYNKAELLIVDFTNPTAPQTRGTLVLPYPFYPRYWFYCGMFDMGFDFGGGWGWRGGYYGDSSWLLTKNGITSLFYHYDQTTGKSERRLAFINLSNPDAPTQSHQSLPTDRFYSSLIRLDDETFYLPNRQASGTITRDGQTFTIYRDYAQVWNFKQGAWVAGNHINVPGRLIKAFTAGNQAKLLSYDVSWLRKPVKQQNGQVYYNYQTIFRLHLLHQAGSYAVLKASQVFNSWNLKQLLLDGQHLYISTNRDWYYLQENKISWSDQSDTLGIYDLSKDTFAKVFEAATRTTNTQLAGVQNKRLFINLPGEGLLVVDVSKPATPDGLHFERTLGWTSNLEISGDSAFVAAGHFGIYTLNLNKITIPSL